MAKPKDRSPTGGKRFQRASPATGKPKASNGPKLDRRNGETMFTPELQARLVKLIQVGNYAEVAARACGISKDTFYAWLLRGGRGEEPFKSLSDAVDTAAAENEAADVARLMQHGGTHWQAVAWRLERKNNKRWGRRDSLELTGDEDRPIAVNQKIDLKKLSTAELRELKRLREKARSEDDETPE